MSASDGGLRVAHDTERTPLRSGESATVNRHIEDFFEPIKKVNVSSPSHFRECSTGRFWVVFSGILFADVVAFFDMTLTSAVHPVIASYFKKATSASWLSTVFLLASTLGQPVYGRISDGIGRRPVYLVSVVIFSLATIWCALAQDFFSFIAARTFAGIGAGGVIAIGTIVINDMVKIEYRGLYDSVLMIVQGAGSCSGAALGGFLVDQFGWRAAFGLQFPVLLLCLMFTSFAMPGNLGPAFSTGKHPTMSDALLDFDFRGSIALCLALISLIMGINLGGAELKWTHPVVLTALALCLVFATVLVHVERSARMPILPLKFLYTPPIANVILAIFFSAIVASTTTFNLPIYFQAVGQESATTSGLYLLTTIVGISVAGAIPGFYITWSRRLKPTIVLGALVLLSGSTSIVFLTWNLPKWTKILMIPIASMGFGLLIPSAIVTLLAVALPEDAAVVTTTLGLCSYLGSVLGVAISSSIFQNALGFFLNRRVTADQAGEKEKIITLVKKSIAAIAELDPVHKSQGMFIGQSICCREKF